MAKIYTKTGDKGKSSLVGGQKVLKNDPRLECYGTVDELNSSLGLVRTEIQSLFKALGHRQDSLSALDADLAKVQHWLFDLGSQLATIPSEREKFKLPSVTLEEVEWMEGKIDAATAVLPPLKTFILPGGSELSARFHLSRTIARRAERCMMELGDENPEFAIPFINRLSDYLFTMARYANFLCDQKDVLWVKNEST